MAKAKNYSTDYFRGPQMRVSYAFQLFKLREAEGGYRPGYGCTLIAAVDADWSPMQNAIAEVVANQPGMSLDKWKAGLIKNPILPGDGKEARSKDTGELHPGMGSGVKFIRVSSGADRKPRVYMPDAVRLIEDPDDCPSGSWGYPILNAFGWHHDQNGAGISFGIDAFQLVKKAEGDEVFAGAGRRADTSKFFEAVKDDGTHAPKGADASSMFG